jgi:hypothetical protein
MTELWYNNPSVLLDNTDQFFPSKNLTRNEKINSLARFSIYYSILVLLFGQDTKLISVGVIILLISIYFGSTETFASINTSSNPNPNPNSNSNSNTKKCQAPTKENPFMNYTVGDLIDNPSRLPACNYEDVKDDIRKEFKSQLHTDISDLWGKFISDRNYYTMPNTDIVNDQTGFALWCFGSSGNCKTEGTDCLKQRDPTYHRGRMTTLDN